MKFPKQNDMGLGVEGTTGQFWIYCVCGARDIQTAKANRLIHGCLYGSGGQDRSEPEMTSILWWTNPNRSPQTRPRAMVYLQSFWKWIYLISKPFACLLIMDGFDGKTKINLPQSQLIKRNNIFRIHGRNKKRHVPLTRATPLQKDFSAEVLSRKQTKIRKSLSEGKV